MTGKMWYTKNLQVIVLVYLENGTPTDWLAQGRIVLGAAPSNDNVIYALYVNGASAIGYGDYYKSYVHFKNLPQIAKTITELEKQIKK